MPDGVDDGEAVSYVTLWFLLHFTHKKDCLIDAEKYTAYYYV